jgi:two-component system, LytTR family, response regulator
MPKHRCIIVDDDAVDLLMSVAHVRKAPFLELLATFSAAQEAAEFLQKNEVEVLFLDIDMPEQTGLEFWQNLQPKPLCVFITAHAEYALDSYESAAFDFLVKPLKTERFERCVARLEEHFTLREKSGLFDQFLGADSFFIKEGHEQHRIRIKDVLYLEALGDYTKIVTTQKKHCVLSTLGTLLTLPEFGHFTRIHRSYAVQKMFVEKISASELMVRGVSLPIGRKYKANLAR